VSWLVRRKFLVLLLTLALLTVIYPVLHATTAERVLWDVFLSFVFVATFFVIFTEKRLKIPALVLGVPTLIGAWIGYAVPGLREASAIASFHILAAVFFGFTVGAILRHIYREETVTVDSIFGAFCGYILVGLAFGHVYFAVELLFPGSIRLDSETSAIPAEDVRRLFHLTYFSMVTLTTLGYGDITPLSHGTRGLAIVEAIMGQFYIAVLIGDLIGKRVAMALAQREARDKQKA